MNESDSASAWRNVPWRGRDMLLACVAAVALVGLGLIGVVIIALIAGIDPMAQEQLHLIVFAVFALEALLILPAWFWGPHKYDKDWGILGFRPAPTVQSIVLIALALVAVLGLNALWAWVMETFNLPGQPDLVPLFGEGVSGFIVAFVVAAIVAPIAEEVFFRGFLYAGMRDRWGLTAGLIVSSLLFGVIHLTPGVILPIVLMGLIFALLYEKTNSLWPAIILHGLINALAVIGAYVG